MAEEMDIDAVLWKVHAAGLPRYPLLVVFFTGGVEPPDCALMLRLPMPRGGFVFGLDFADRVQDAIGHNDSAHDGAVAFGRTSDLEPYKCAGWSYRIVAKQRSPAAEPNRGAAYNSAISLSLSAGVDRVCLFSRSELEIFVRGERAAS